MEEGVMNLPCSVPSAGGAGGDGLAADVLQITSVASSVLSKIQTRKSGNQANGVQGKVFHRCKEL